MELLDFVAAKFHEEGGVFKLLVSKRTFLLILVLVINSKSNQGGEQHLEPGFPCFSGLSLCLRAPHW